MLELYEGLAEAGVPVIGGDTTAADRARTCRVTALGRSERVPGRGGAQARRRARRHRPARRRGRGLSRAALRASAAPARRGTAPRRRRARDARPLGRARRDAGHIAARSGCRLVIELERVPLAAGRALDDLGFGEDYELLAALSERGAASPRSAAARRARASSCCCTASPYELDRLRALSVPARPSRAVLAYVVRRLRWAVVLCLILLADHVHDLLRRPAPAGAASSGRGGFDDLHRAQQFTGPDRRQYGQWVAASPTARSGHSYVSRRPSTIDPQRGSAGHARADDRRRGHLDADRPPLGVLSRPAAALAARPRRRRSSS